MKIRTFAVVGAALLAAAIGSSGAQEPGRTPAPAAPAVPEYKVEVVLFAYRDRNPAEEELEHRAPGMPASGPIERREPPRFFGDFGLEPLGDEPAASNVFGDLALLPLPQSQTTDTGLRFRLLQPEELQLTAQYQTLSRIPAYLLLAHGGWVQQGLPENQSRPFDLALLGVPNPRGSIRLRLSRFLNVVVDLSYQDGTRGGGSAEEPFSLRELALAPRYALTAERQIRSGEVHYFDHPAFGLLVLVTPLPADATPITPRSAEPAA